MKSRFILTFLIVVMVAFAAKATPCTPPAAITGPDTVCPGALITLTDATTGGTWSSSDASRAIIDPVSGIVTGVAGGHAVITYLLSSGCYATRAIVIDTLLPVTGPAAICAGADTTFHDLTPGGAWSSSNTGVATIGTGTGAAAAVASGNTIITYTLGNGCSSRLSLTVNPLPLNYYVFGGGNYCAGTSGAGIALNGSDSGINYLLYNSTTFVDSQHGTGSALFYGPYTPAGVYSMIGVNMITGCSNHMSGTASIGITPLNVPSVTVTTPVGDTVCILANTTFTANPVNEGPSPSYQWYVNGASVGTGITYSYIPANDDVVTVTLYSDAVCAIPSTATATMTMTTIPKVNPSVTIAVIPGDTICATVHATIIPTPVYGGPTPNYRWIKNGVTAAYGTTYDYLPTTGDNIICTIYSNYECLITDSAYSTNNIIMTVEPLYTPTVTVTTYRGDTLTAGTHDTLTAAVVNGGPTVHYQWLINGSPVPGAVTDTFIFADSTHAGRDTITCVATSINMCAGPPARDSIVITDTLLPDTSHVGTALISYTGGDITILPNPNKGLFTINANFPGEQTVTIELTDVLGRQMYKQAATVVKGKLNALIELDAQLTNGVYLVHVSCDRSSVVRRVLVER